MWAAHDGHADMIPPLLQAGADVNARTVGGSTALMWAANNGHVNVIPLLLKAGADVNAKNMKGFTALIWAAGKGHANVISLLLQAGADVDAKENHGLNAEDFAETSRPEIVSLIEDWKKRAESKPPCPEGNIP